MMTLRKTRMETMSFFRPFVSLLMTAVNYTVHASAHWWRQTRNWAPSHSPVYGPSFTLNTDVSLSFHKRCTSAVDAVESEQDHFFPSKISNIPRMAHILCILAILSFALCFAENTQTEKRYKDLQLQQDSSTSLNKLQETMVRRVSSFNVCSSLHCWSPNVT